MALFAVCATAIAQDSIPSPDGRLIVHRTPNPTHGIGKRLFVRLANSNDPGRLLLENDRSMDAQWSPDSKFLAVTNYTDPHMSVVLVFGIRSHGKAPDAELLFISPDPGVWDTKWIVSGWDTPHRTILLQKRVAGKESVPIKRFRIGNKPLELPH
jgi:hypothetical protein